jgi:hypothetical protein
LEEVSPAIHHRLINRKRLGIEYETARTHQAFNKLLPALKNWGTRSYSIGQLSNEVTVTFATQILSFAASLQTAMRRFPA